MCVQCLVKHNRKQTRGAPRGVKQVPWTDAEWAIINDSLDNGIKGRRVIDLAPLLPRRTKRNIHNALNVARRRRKSLCMAGCGDPVPTPDTTCISCKETQKGFRRKRIRECRCAACGLPLGDGASATLCSTCRTKRQIQNAAYSKTTKFKKQSQAKKDNDPRLKSRRVLPWPACGHTKWASILAAKTKRPVIDIFGGSGEPLRLVHDFNGHAHHYNDLHPGLVAIAQLVKDGRERELVQALQTGTSQDPNVALAAQTIRQARRPGSKFDKRIITNMRHLGRALAKTIITNIDGVDLLKQQHPKDAIFLIDPPWPGADQAFEHKLDPHQWVTLFNTLLDIPLEQDYIIMLGAERDALALIAKHMPHAPLFWRRSGQYARSLVSLSPRLARESEAPGQPVDLEALGL